MEKNQKDLVNWCLKKAEEYLESADENFKKKRFYPVAEEIFRSVETTLEGLLYYYGVKKISYPGKDKEFTGRLALQFLIRDTLVKRGKLKTEVYNKYLEIASDLHKAGYTKEMILDKKELKNYLEFADNLFIKVKSLVT